MPIFEFLTVFKCSNYIQNVWIYVQMLKECVFFSTCSWKMASSDDAGKKISQLHQELVNVYKKKNRFLLGKEGVFALSVTYRKRVLVKKRNKAWGWGVGGSKKAILVWRNYWMAPHPNLNFWQSHTFALKDQKFIST